METQLDATVDFLTAVSPFVIGECHKRLVYCVKHGKIRPWKMRTFRGVMSADDRGGIAYGMDAYAGRVIVQLWGEYTWYGYNLTGHHRITRVDFQITLADYQFDVLNNFQNLDRSSAILTHKGGGTLYIGSRSSEKFGRIYDKGAQLGITPNKLWRFEVEYKGKCAASAYDLIRGQPSDKIRGIVISNVAEFFREHGIILVVDSNVCSIVRYGTRTRDTEKTLQWIRQQVRPAVMRLLNNGVEVEKIARAFGVTTAVMNEVISDWEDAHNAEERLAYQMSMWLTEDEKHAIMC